MIQKFNMKIAGLKFDLILDLEPDKFYSDAVLATLLPKGILPEPEVVNALPHLLKPGDCCVDAGANIGFFTILMSKLVGAKGEVIAVEPDPRNMAKLARNCSLNDCTNVVFRDYPLAEKAEKRTFYIQGENGSSTLFDGADKETCGELVQAEDMMTGTLTVAIGDRKPVLLKLDVEGAELSTMNGCDYKFPFVIAEINEEALKRAGTTPELFRFGMEFVKGYRMHILSDIGSMPARVADYRTQKLVTTRPNANVLFAAGDWSVIHAWPEVVV